MKLTDTLTLTGAIESRTETILTWGKLLGLKPGSIRARRYRGYSVTEALMGRATSPAMVAHNQRLGEMKRVPMVGKRFGSLVVVAPLESRDHRWFWAVRCDCGTEKAADGKSLREGRIKSCGAAQHRSERTKRSWANGSRRPAGASESLPVQV